MEFDESISKIKEDWSVSDCDSDKKCGSESLFKNSGPHSMRLVKSISDLRENMSVLDSYLERKCDSEYTFALDLVKKGTCFIAVKTDIGYRFYPSRFMGYAANSMDNHLSNQKKDGKETTPVISKILGQKASPNAEMEAAYISYCEYLGFTANEKGTFGVKRKYWVLE